ncbi:Chromosome-associated kinesin KIF4A [Trichinella patagoniensis]|uniref:Chromosome-associated kinesin KIF4A n=1 Tax=Trichinella patagoniensis TaxID=990121 RepID=A0A0V1AES5_9BILA|nr:Chromosome-associated kinesin KIF4A [Trichinella patagoniensis]
MSDKVIPVRVAVRCRPLLKRELNESASVCLTCDSLSNEVIIDDRIYGFDHVFESSSTQQLVFNACALPLLEKFLEGYNCTIFAYGQTGSGKTYTMGTEELVGWDVENTGLIGKIVAHLFQQAEKCSDEFECSFRCSMLEIYNELVFDILGEREQLNIREHATGGIYVCQCSASTVQNLTEQPVKSLSDAQQFIIKGCYNRSKGETAMNSRSSRSHAIFTIYMDKVSKESSSVCYKAKLNLVDLAGSERLKKTQAQGDRMKEGKMMKNKNDKGIKINEGLLVLGNVISALTLNDGNSKMHIPYRDSKLTRILQDSLGGNSVTVMIACISPAASNHDETLNTLRYAERAKNIKNKPMVNLDPMANQLLRLQKENEELRHALEATVYTKKYIGVSEEFIAEYEAMKRRNVVLFQQHNDMEMQRDYYKDMLWDVREKLAETSSMATVEEIVSHVQVIVNSITPPPKDDSVNEAKLSDDFSSFDEMEFLDKQDRLALEVDELSSKIKEKQQMLDVAVKTIGVHSETPVEQNNYQAEMNRLKNVIKNLIEEKTNLEHQITAIQNTNKVESTRRQKIKELEKAIATMSKEMLHMERLKKNIVNKDKNVNNLKSEVTELRKMKVQLIRKHKEEVNKFMKWKAKTNREINELKQKEKRSAMETLKVRVQLERRLNVLRKKYETSMSMIKRLKKDKVGRGGGMGEQKKQISAEEIKKMLLHEIDLAVHCAEAEKLCDQLLDEISSMFLDLKNNFDKKNTLEEPSSSFYNTFNYPIFKFCQYDRSRSYFFTHDSNMPYAEIQKSIQIRNEAIVELRKQISNFENAKRGEACYDEINDVNDARVALKFLSEMMINTRVQLIQLEREMGNANKKAEKLEKEKTDLFEENNCLKNDFQKHQSEMDEMRKKNSSLQNGVVHEESVSRPHLDMNSKIENASRNIENVNPISHKKKMSFYNSPFRGVSVGAKRIKMGETSGSPMDELQPYDIQSALNEKSKSRPYLPVPFIDVSQRSVRSAENNDVRHADHH